MDYKTEQQKASEIVEIANKLKLKDFNIYIQHR